LIVNQYSIHPHVAASVENAIRLSERYFKEQETSTRYFLRNPQSLKP